MQTEFKKMRMCGIGLLIVLLSVLTVHYFFLGIGVWPPFWSAIIAAYFLASMFWLLVVFVTNVVIFAAFGRYTIQTLLALMTTVAALLGATRLLGFYPTLIAFLLILILASLVRVDSNQLYSIRRDYVRRAPRLLRWLPGAFTGGIIFSAIHLYDLQVRGLNAGKLELHFKLCILATFCCVLGALSQVLMIRGFHSLATTLRWQR